MLHKINHSICEILRGDESGRLHVYCGYIGQILVFGFWDSGDSFFLRFFVERELKFIVENVICCL